MTLLTNLKKLYEIDDSLWLEETIELLRNRQFDQLDLENLIEELEALGRRDKASIESLFIHLIEHLLIYEYWLSEREYNGNHWRREITNFRFQLDSLLTTNYRNYLLNNQTQLYLKGKKLATEKSGLNFPEKCPYNLKQLLDENWLP
jgi:hypothetical protein